MMKRMAAHALLERIVAIADKNARIPAMAYWSIGHNRTRRTIGVTQAKAKNMIIKIAPIIIQTPVISHC